MSVYLEDHPPARRQFYNPRRAEATGAIVAHTAENATDLVLPDGGAEGVAAFISRRSDPGSYHSVVDSDSIVKVGRYEWEMFGEGTGGNRWALHLSFACQAAQWGGGLTPDWVYGAIVNGAAEAAAMIRWVKATRGIDIPLRRITRAEYFAGRPGFIPHADLDPGRRSDPGQYFPWDLFFGEIPNHLEGAVVAASHITTWQQHLIDNNYDLGATGADGDFGPATLDASLSRSGWVPHLNQQLASTQVERDTFESAMNAARAERDELAGQLAGANGQLDEAGTRIEELQQDLAGAQTDLEAAQARIAELEAAGGVDAADLLDRLQRIADIAGGAA